MFAAFSTVLLWTAALSLSVCVAAEIPAFTPCATDPAYREFERFQYDAYTASRGSVEMLQRLRDDNEPENVRKIFQETRKRFEQRVGDSPINSDGWREQRIIEQIAKLKLPTCYESRQIYWSIGERAAHIERARKELGLELNRTPKFASLPTSDPNAYTYPVLGGRESVIGFNTELMKFNSLMAHLFVPTIWTAHTDPPNAVFESQEFRSHYLSMIMGFLSVVPEPYFASPPDYDLFTSSMVEGMELFAVGHEYGHLIRNHQSGKNRKLRLGSNMDCDADGVTFTVLARSWQQELDADQIGVQLLFRALRDGTEVSHMNPDKVHYSLRSVLFYFKCQALLEAARDVAKGNTAALIPPAADQEFIRSIADGRTSAQARPSSSSYVFDDHPPAWLRLERLEPTVERYLSTAAASSEFAGWAKTMSDRQLKNINLAWEFNLPELTQALKTFRGRPGQPKNGACAEAR